MAKRVKVKLNNKGFAELRNSPEVQADLTARARRIQAAAGDGFEARDASPGTKGARPRARASVGTASIKGNMRQGRDPVLQNALDAGRG